MDEHNDCIFSLNKTNMSKIRRLIFPISWDEFVLAPTLSIIQFGIIACLLVVMFGSLNNKNNISTTSLQQDCNKELSSSDYMLKITEIRVNLLNIQIEKKKYQLTALEQEQLNKINNKRTTLKKDLEELNANKDTETKDCASKAYSIATELMNNGREYTELLRQIKKSN